MALCCKKTLAALTAALMLAAPAWAETVLKVVPHADLKVLDPVWTTAFVTRHHGYMIYDTLFGLTQKGEIKPQLVDTYTASPDNLHYSFTLREGLKFLTARRSRPKTSLHPLSAGVRVTISVRSCLRLPRSSKPRTTVPLRSTLKSPSARCSMHFPNRRPFRFL